MAEKKKHLNNPFRFVFDELLIFFIFWVKVENKNQIACSIYKMVSGESTQG